MIDAHGGYYFDEAAIRAHLAAHGVEIESAGERYGAAGNGPSLYLQDAYVEWKINDRFALDASDLNGVVLGGNIQFGWI